MQDSISKEVRSRLTFRYDVTRGVFNSIIYTGLMTLAILVALKYYNAPGWVKGCIAGAEQMGRMLTPLTVFFAARSSITAGKLASLFMFLTAGGLLLTAGGSTLPFYAGGIVLSYMFFTQPPQLMISIYSKNYDRKIRGSRVSMMFAVGTFVGTISSILIGRMLDANLEYYKYALVGMAMSGVVCGLLLTKIPSEPLNPKSSGTIWQNISLLWTDRIFGWLVVGYVLLGVGNTMLIPLRVEYLARPEYGINASYANIALINVAIPGVTIILFTRLWGWFFDKYHFITTRLLINLSFFISAVAFFASSQMWVMVVSMVFNGIAVAGGMIVWHLWVTKVAPDDQVSAYMSAHTAMSGLKGFFAPQIGYLLLPFLSPLGVGIVGGVLILMSSLMFFHVRKDPRIT